MADPNRLPIPTGKSTAYGQGWRAREHGSQNCPYELSLQPQEWRDWHAGDDDRADRGFKVDHLPRTASGAFAV